MLQVNKNNIDRDLRDKLHEQFLKEIDGLYKSKNADYGDSVHKTYEKYGMLAYLVRVEDKINRVINIIDRGEHVVMDERLKDSLLDAANYLILAAIELEMEKSTLVSSVSDFDYTKAYSVNEVN